jgi:hypothetical protein
MIWSFNQWGRAMKLNYAVAGIPFLILSAWGAHAGDALIDLHVTIGSYQGDTDLSGSFAVRGLKSGKYDVILSGNPIKSYLGSDGSRISLMIDGKRYRLICPYDGCKAKGVPIKASSKGKITLAN